MTERTTSARLISRAIVVASLAMIAIDVGLLVSLDRRPSEAKVYIVGDPSAPGMAEVRADIERRLAHGELSEPKPLEPVLFGAFGLVWALTGSLIVSRQPRNLAGWIFSAVGAALPLNGLVQAYTLYSVKSADASLPGQGLTAIVGEYTPAVIALIPLLFLLFPDGRPPSPRWRWAVRLLGVGFVLAIGTFALQPGPLNNLVDSGVLYQNPLGIQAFADGEPGSFVLPLGVLMMLGTSLATVLAVRQRFRRSVGEVRQQMRWLLAVATAAGIGLLLSSVVAPIADLVVGSARGNDALPIFNITFVATALTVALGIPAAYLVAIFRYRLWDLDVVIRKAVLAALVVAGVTAAGFLALGLVPILVVGGIPSEISTVSVAVGLALGLLVGPLRRRARRLADRIVYGKRATPYEVLSEFSDRVSGTYSTEEVLPRMAQILAMGTGAESATAWLRVGDQLRPVTGDRSRGPLPVDGDELPRFPEGEHAVEVRHQGELLGALSVRMSASDPIDPAKAKLVRNLAAQAGLVLRNVRLIEDLRASRQRLVAAQDEERRKLERNIHDGAQQQLVALAIKLRLAQGLASTDPAGTEALLSGLQTETQAALEDLRDLARGIYPPLLADKGLPTALEAQARRSPIPVQVRDDGIGRFPRTVESAVYFCALEALNNVAKYADASTATITLEASDGRLRFTVRDDGRGFDTAATTHGTGLQGMADRLEALGGTLEVRSAPGAGTTITGNVPVNGGPA